MSRRLDLEPGERPLFALMGLLVGVLFGAYTLAKIMRDALFLAHFGALALPYAYIAVAIASAGYVWLEARATRRHTRRLGNIALTQLVAIAGSALAAFLFPFERRWVAGAFYLWTGAQAMMLLSHFWVLALDVWDPRRARRMFPMFTGCGLFGGTLAGAYAAWASTAIGRDAILWSIVVLLVGAHVLTRQVNARRVVRPAVEHAPPPQSRVRILFASPFLRFLSASLALSVIVSTLVDFQFKYLVQKAYPNPWTLTRFLGAFYGGLNALALLAQFGVAGRVLQRVGLGPAAELQPISVLTFAVWMVFAPSRWLAMAMRWIQGVIFQTLGKSSAEIYYMALRPPERRHIKPAIDTVVERWSDAVVGVLLIVGLHWVGVSLPGIAVITGTLAMIWFFVLMGLNRHYVRAFREALASRWGDPELAAHSTHIPAAREAMLDALESGEERRVLLALNLAQGSRHPRVVAAVSRRVEQGSPRVRTAAVRALEAMGIQDREGRIAEFLTDPNEEVRRAVLSYLIAMGAHPDLFARLAIEGGDLRLRELVIDALLEHPGRGAGAVPLQWIDTCIARDDPAEVVVAARALGLVGTGPATARLAKLLVHRDPEVRRNALVAAARRPSITLLPTLLRHLRDPMLAAEARRAIAAVGNPAVPALEQLLAEGESARVRELAAHTLATIATRRSANALVLLARSGEPVTRSLGLVNLGRVRRRWGRPVLPRHRAHKMFLRELRDYRSNLEPGLRLETHSAPEVRLLGESYRELANVSVARAMESLATSYDPELLSWAADALRSGNRGSAAAAIEYLHHVLPRSVFAPLATLFEEGPLASSHGPATDDGTVDADIRAAWTSTDSWLRACALRAARAVPTIDPRELVALVSSEEEDRVVAAEIAALNGSTTAAASAARGGVSC